jgi:DeoR family transcriptional regulator, glycerol-3-phosphate regulon repressor
LDAHQNHTQQAIVTSLRRAGGSLRISALADQLHVSEETIRRNLKRLASRGAVVKMHGGAKLSDVDDEGDFHQRLSLNPEAKKMVARTAAGMIHDGSSIFLDVGSTTSYIADALRDHHRLMVVTNSVSVAYKLATRNGNRVYMAGGELRAHDGGAFGSEALTFARNFKTDFAVLSAAGINARHGFMLFDLEEAMFSRAILENAAHGIVAADGSKFGRPAPITVCDPADIDHLVTDRPPEPDLAAALKGWDIALTIAR